MNHLAYLIPTLDRIGGAERQVILLAKGMHRRGWRVSVIALAGQGGAAAGELAEAGVEFASLAMRKGLADPRGWIRLNRWLRREQPAVLHAHLPHAAWMARWSRLAAPVRVAIDTIHTSATGTWGRRLGYRCSAWLPDRVTAVGEGVREAWVAARMVAPESCVVIPNGVDTDAWHPGAGARIASRKEAGLGDGFVWFAAGRLDPVKDYETMLRAFAQAPKNALMVIAGAGPLEAGLRQLAADLEIADRVRLLGFEPNVLRWMQVADGFVLSSRWEGLPTALIEAAACALPAVATDVPGSREVIAEGKTGWLVPVGSSTVLSAKMRLCMQLPTEERNAMGQRARSRAIERYSLERVLDQWAGLYRELLDRNPAPRRWRR